MNNINNPIYFTARMNTNKVTFNEKRWQKIASLFETKTPSYPNDTFYMTELPNGISAYNLNKKNGEEFSVDFVGSAYDRLMNLKDEQIVSKFKKLLKISHKNTKIYEKTQKFINSINKKDTGNLDELALWDLVVNKTSKDNQKIIDKDPILKHADILY